MASSGPNRVVQSPRQVIERKLLAALDDAAKVAILAGKEDLDLLIFCVSTIAAGKYEASAGRLRGQEEVMRELRAREYLQSLEQLHDEAFGEPT